MQEKQHCSQYYTSNEDSELAEILVHYVMGIYKDGTTKQMIEGHMQNLKNLAEANTKDLSLEYINKGLFTTEELILLNNINHRSNFIGPYTACLRLLISTLPGVSGNATLREDLMLFNYERSTETFENENQLEPLPYSIFA